MYCDMKAFSKKIGHCFTGSCKLYTCTMSKFEACSYGYHVVCVEDRYTKPPVIYGGPDAARYLIENLLQEELRIKTILEKNRAVANVVDR